jgi:hypothetical protein
MSQAMTIYQPAARPQQTFRVGYDMPAMDVRAGEAFQRPHYAAVRSRLLGARPVSIRKPFRAWSYAPAPLPVLPVEEETIDKPRAIPHGWRAIVTRVAQRHGVSSADILGKSRCRPIMAARQEAIYHVVVETGMTLPMIGRRFRRDHTTILHNFRAHKAKLQDGTAQPRDMILTAIPDNATLKQRCQEVVRFYAVKYGVSSAQIYGHQRRRDLFEARKEVFLTLYRDHGLNYSEIGQGVGDRDHSTIIKMIGHLVGPKVEAAA